jgi:hypothetical protein
VADAKPARDSTQRTAAANRQNHLISTMGERAFSSNLNLGKVFFPQCTCNAIAVTQV